jgi:uncharacterized iron-regulated protein
MDLNMGLLRFSVALLLLLSGMSSVMGSPGLMSRMSASGHGMHSTDHADIGHNRETSVLDIRTMSRLDDIIKVLSNKDVIHIGESHDQYSHHMAQLEIIRAVHATHPNLAIGMEMFQQPFQKFLDKFISGELGEQEMLRQTEYFTRWAYDYRLYKPILDFARENGIPVVALNIEKEITSKVGDVGIKGLDAEDKKKIPTDIDDSNAIYRQQLEKVFAQHPHDDNSSFERFMQVQLLWDEGMAARVAGYLQQHPGRKMVVLAGSRHVAYGIGIPDRIRKRMAVDSAIVLPGDAASIEPGIADFIIYPRSVKLPPAGLMGIFLGQANEDGVEATEVSANGAAAKAGVEKGDRIYQINDHKIITLADIKIALMNMQPGEQVSIRVNRRRLLVGNHQLEFSFELGPQ